MWSLFFVPWRKLGLLTSEINSVERPGFSRQIDVIHEVDHKLVIMDSKSSGAVLNSNQVWNNNARQTRMTHLQRIVDALEGEIGEPRLHVVDPSSWLSSLLLGFEYGLGALDKQVGRVLALNLWSCGEKFWWWMCLCLVTEEIPRRMFSLNLKSYPPSLLCW